MRLTILRIKPNPAGKDRPSHGGPTPSQLGGEWVDFRNDTGGAVSLAGVALYHLAYASSGEAAWQRVMGFKGDLPASEIVRVHSGKVRDVSVINNEDRVERAIVTSQCAYKLAAQYFVWAVTIDDPWS